MSFRILPVFPVLASNYISSTPNRGVKTTTKLSIVANIHANPDQIELVKVELKKLFPISRVEKGCIQYDLNRDNDNPAHFMLFENWESRELWQIHVNSPHLAAYMTATAGSVAEIPLNEMPHNY